ncbi:EF-hand domain-containing protein [Hoeflea marina]|nr:acid-shock protein [Hoeflea marina]
MNRTLIAMAGIAGMMIAAPALAQDATAPATPSAEAGANPDATAPIPGKMGKMGHGGMMARLDADKSGDISSDEFADIGVGRLVKADSNGDGELSIDEIQTAMEAQRKERMAEMYKRRFDINGDGKITVSELTSQQDKRFALLDSNDDGSISPKEFRKMRHMMARGGMDGDFDGRGGRGGGRKHHGGAHDW